MEPTMMLVETEPRFFETCGRCGGWGEHNPYDRPVDCHDCGGTGETYVDLSWAATLVHNLAIAGAITFAAGHDVRQVGVVARLRVRNWSLQQDLQRVRQLIALVRGNGLADASRFLDELEQVVSP